MLQTTEFSTHRVQGPSSGALTKHSLQGFARSDIHQPAACGELHCARMRKRHHWSSFPSLHARSHFYGREPHRIRGLEAGQVSNGGVVAALTTVAVLDQEIRHLGARMLQSLDLMLLYQRLQRSYLCLHSFHATSHGSSCKFLAALVVVLPLILQSIELFLGRMDGYRVQDESLNAVTNPYAADVNLDQQETFNAAIQPYEADVSQDEHDRFNAVTPPFNDEAVEYAEENCVYAPTRPEQTHRYLLLGASELSFVLWEESQPCCDNDSGDGEDDDFCVPTKRDFPPQKVHALLKYWREKRSVAEENNKSHKAPPLSPKNSIDETAPRDIFETSLEPHGRQFRKTRACKHPIVVSKCSRAKSG
ncbi:uncharacterized protein [Dermacentor albipictus]|uniref:uncharacterized protein n=1 Tax=Dermacentor albipictus TaxID=60249 RepID=UPI0031FC4D67